MFDLQTADENWNPSLLDESSRLFFKVSSSATVVGRVMVVPGLTVHAEHLHKSSHSSRVASDFHCIHCVPSAFFKYSIKLKLLKLLLKIDQIPFGRRY